MKFFGFDDDYVRRLRERDPETERHFFSYFSGLLRIMLSRRLSPDILEDVVQDVLYRTLTGIYAGKLRQGGALGAYVKSVADNVVKEGFRKEGRTDQLDDDIDPPSPDDATALAMDNELKVRVRAALAKLDAREAAILKAFFLDEEDKDTICRRYDITRDYLRVVLHRALKHFRDKFDKN